MRVRSLLSLCFESPCTRAVGFFLWMCVVHLWMKCRPVVSSLAITRNQAKVDFFSCNMLNFYPCQIP